MPKDIEERSSERDEAPKKPPCPKCLLSTYVKVRKGLPNECTHCNISF